MKNPENHNDKGGFVTGNTAAKGRREPRGRTMKTFQDRIFKCTSIADFDEIWAKALESAKKGNYAFIKLVLEFCVGRVEDVQLRQECREVIEAVEQHKAKNVIGRVG